MGKKYTRTKRPLDEKGIQDFWQKVAAPNERGCMEFSGSRGPTGYGCHSFKSFRHYAHRLSWELTNGEIPEGMHVLHRCDNPPCCNPDHLFIGTPKDNVKDMVQKGRKARFSIPGYLQSQSKLSVDDIRSIRERYQPGKTKHKRVTLPMLAAEYGVAISLIERVVKRTQWECVS
jgi:hypothetical protein